jgi:hypothetical protein
MSNKQIELFSKENSGLKNDKYNMGIGSPVYGTKNLKPPIEFLCSDHKAKKLIEKIKQSSVSEEEKKFLINAAFRHLVFNYEKIADYYAHASKEMQELIEESALIIIDFDQAIELGYIKICEDIRKQYLTEYAE